MRHLRINAAAQRLDNIGSTGLPNIVSRINTADQLMARLYVEPGPEAENEAVKAIQTLRLLDKIRAASQVIREESRSDLDATANEEPSYPWFETETKQDIASIWKLLKQLPASLDLDGLMIAASARPAQPASEAGTTSQGDGAADPQGEASSANNDPEIRYVFLDSAGAELLVQQWRKINQTAGEFTDSLKAEIEGVTRAADETLNAASAARRLLVVSPEDAQATPAAPTLERVSGLVSDLEAASEAMDRVVNLAQDVEQGLATLDSTTASLSTANIRIEDELRRLASAGQTGSGPIAYALLLVGGMLITVGVASLVLWAKHSEDARRNVERMSNSIAAASLSAWAAERKQADAIRPVVVGLMEEKPARGSKAFLPGQKIVEDALAIAKASSGK